MLTKDQLESITMFHMYAMEFLASMILLDESNDQLNRYNAKYDMLHRSNKLQAIEYFHQYVYPCKSYIIDNDINYFLNIEKNTNLVAHEDSLIEALQLRKLWERLTESEKEQNKEHIFQYLKILMFYMEKYYGM